MDVSDWTDQASELEQLQRDQAMAAIPRYQGISRESCLDCGDEIPAKRRELVPGCMLCAHCAGMAEERARK